MDWDSHHMDWDSHHLISDEACKFYWPSVSSSISNGERRRVPVIPGKLLFLSLIIKGIKHSADAAEASIFRGTAFLETNALAALRASLKARSMSSTAPPLTKPRHGITESNRILTPR